MLLKKKHFKVLFIIVSLCSLQAVYAPPEAKTGKFTFSFPKEFDANVNIGPSTFIFAASCATFGLFYQGIKKLSEGLAEEHKSNATKEGCYLISGGLALLAGVTLVVFGYQKYNEDAALEIQEE